MRRDAGPSPPARLSGPVPALYVFRVSGLPHAGSSPGFPGGDGTGASHPAALVAALFQQSPFSQVLYDADGHIVAANPAFRALWGVDVASAPPDYSVLTDPLLDQLGVLGDVRRAFAGETVLTPPLRYDIGALSADGSGRAVWTQGHFVPVRDASGRLTNVLLTHVDLTARMEAEQANDALRRSAAQSRLLAEAGRLLAAPRGERPTADIIARIALPSFADYCVVFALDPSGSIRRVAAVHADPSRQALLDRLGTKPPAPTPDNFLSRVLRTGRPELYEHTTTESFATVSRDPGYLETLQLLGPRSHLCVALPAGEGIIGALLFVRTRDEAFTATDLDTAEEIGRRGALALGHARLYEAERQARERLRLATLAAGVGIWDYEPGSGVLVWDERCKAAFGLDADAPITFDVWAAAMHPEDRAGAIDAVTAALDPDGDGDFDREYRAITPSGDTRWLRAIGRAFFELIDGHRQPVRFTGTVLDVTSRKDAERETARLYHAERSARISAEAANRAKSEFLAVMSHELRTPLNAIGGYAELLEMGLRGPITPEQRDDLERIQRSQRHLLGLINDVLDYARIETGAARLRIEAVGLAEAFASAEALVSPQARAKGITLRAHPPSSDLAVRADRERLRQVLVNLLANAVKFTSPGGEIDLRVQARDDVVEIAVRDDGIGIPADKLELIFEPFVQVSQGLTRSAEGTGLGLAISRDLARAMGGDLVARSELGKGSVFTLVLPRAA